MPSRPWRGRGGTGIPGRSVSATACRPTLRSRAVDSRPAPARPESAGRRGFPAGAADRTRRTSGRAGGSGGPRPGTGPRRGTAARDAGRCRTRKSRPASYGTRGAVQGPVGRLRTVWVAWSGAVSGRVKRCRTRRDALGAVCAVWAKVPYPAGALRTVWAAWRRSRTRRGPSASYRPPAEGAAPGGTPPAPYGTRRDPTRTSGDPRAMPAARRPGAPTRPDTPGPDVRHAPPVHPSTETP